MAVDIDYTKLKTIPLGQRNHLVHVEDFGDPAGHSVRGFVESLPRFYAARDLNRLILALEASKATGRGRIWSLGAHVIKCGLSRYMTSLMARGYVTHLALNGAGIIHDFEVALAGQTSEIVEEAIRDGSFGMARETSEHLSELVCSGAARERGLGEVLGEAMDQAGFPHRDLSLLVQARRHGVTASIHMALGTDVLHYHPAFDWGQAAQASRVDFDRFVKQVATLDGGGTYLNVGSAVLLPEIFLKAVSIVRNLGHPMEGFTTAVLDMIDHYRPRENVLRRPGGAGLRILGHHEILIPLITCALS